MNKISFWLSIALGIATFLTGSANWVDTGLDPTTVKHVLAWVSIAAGIGNIVNAAFVAGGATNAMRMLTFRQP